MSLHITDIGGAYAVAAPDSHLRLIFDRVKDRNGELSAQLKVIANDAGAPIILCEADRVNLNSHRSRDEFSKRMTGLYKTLPLTDWKRLVDSAAVLVVRQHRQGEPVIVVGSDTPLEKMVPRLAPIVGDKCPSMLFGPGGEGKSYLGQYLGLIVAQGGQHCPFHGIRGPVLFCDYESDKDIFIERTILLQHGNPALASAKLLYRRCILPLAHDVAAVHRIVAEHGVKMIVVDSVAPACGGQLETPESAIALFRAIRALHVSALLLAHTQKNSEEKSPFGSVFFTNYPRDVWELQKQQEVGATHLTLAVHHYKNNHGPKHPTIGLRLDFGSDQVTVAPADLSEQPVLLPLHNRIRNLLEDGGDLWTAHAIAEAVGAPLATVKATLSKYRGFKWCLVGENKGARWTCLNHR